MIELSRSLLNWRIHFAIRKNKDIDLVWRWCNLNKLELWSNQMLGI